MWVYLFHRNKINYHFKLMRKQEERKILPLISSQGTFSSLRTSASSYMGKMPTCWKKCIHAPGLVFRQGSFELTGVFCFVKPTKALSSSSNTANEQAKKSLQMTAKQVPRIRTVYRVIFLFCCWFWLNKLPIILVCASRGAHT